VPLRRVNARYVIATSQKIDVSGVDTKIVDKVSQEGYFTKDKADKKKGEEAFFKQGEKAEVCYKARRKVSSMQADDFVEEASEQREG
jgi:large subunit ribosomal protein L6e